MLKTQLIADQMEVRTAQEIEQNNVKKFQNKSGNFLTGNPKHADNKVAQKVQELIRRR